MKTLYLAGPDVFAPSPRELGAAKKAICRHFGLTGVFPMDVADLDPALPLTQQGLVVFDALERAMRACDGVLVNLTPFHGLSMDVGSAFEMGFMRALGKPVFAYSNSGATLKERAVAFWDGRAGPDEGGFVRDPDFGMEIDGLGTVDNLMVDGCIVRSTGVLCIEEVAGPDRFSALGSFEACVRAAADWLAHN